ncbi:putative cytochrome P450 monooxygenase [Aspergillus steynii IBT 23096]|uniref:Putative cytochrome P450 monooxygenase n=1 Tax=Aspergillus steynii IBT 23096 TaxID=1392250 RepID=A0A2I2G6P6_9EURO|nr:putative cytochrome P450 monooxygenase [Aspergillus steynii IBT 23096]PLB48551.1 putative cytochrome P450 monooxygenase [Aspergillus steynii IBT 23096]
MDQLLLLVAFSLLEGYLLQRSIFLDVAFRTLCLASFGLNLVLLGIWNVLIYPIFVTPLRHLPTLGGNLNHFRILLDEPRGRLPLEWMKTIPNEGLIHFRDFLNRSHLLVTNHQALLDIMSTHTYDFEKPWRARDFLARIIGFGLILSEGGTHKKQRKALTPSFHVKNIRALYSLMWEKTGLLMDELEKEMRLSPMEGAMSDREGKIEMSVWASRLTLDIIGPAAMGRDFRSLQNPENKVADSFLAILEPTTEKMVFLAVNFVLPQWFARHIPWHPNRVVDHEVGFLRNLCKDIVHEKRAAMTASSTTAKELEADILGSMMLGGDFTDEELVDQMLTFLAAGHETTASAFTWACYLLTLHPEIQDRLREEIRQRIRSGSHPITWSDLESMPLLNGVCQEVLRLYPTVPVTLRESIRDSTLAGKHVPKGTRIILCPYAINRSPEFWGDDGETFRPERWIDTDKNGQAIVNHTGGASTNFAQITFLHGQRACIGKDFARAELRCAVAGVVGRFQFEMQDPKQKIHIAGAVTTKPVEGMHLRMRRVDGW